jgi:anti-anti-sigma regulatory factor
VSGELGIARAPQLEDALGCAQADAALVMLDLPELALMHSSAAHLIEAATGRARRAAGRLVVARDPVEAERIFALVGLDRQPELVDHPPAPPLASVPDRGLRP